MAGSPPLWQFCAFSIYKKIPEQVGDDIMRVWILRYAHDDAKREYNYNTDKPDWEANVQKYGWTLVSMKNDFRTIYARQR